VAPGREVLTSVARSGEVIARADRRCFRPEVQGTGEPEDHRRRRQRRRLLRLGARWPFRDAPSGLVFNAIDVPEGVMR
jgi:hypothetical protein